MGFEKQRRAVHGVANLSEVQRLTSTGTATRVQGYGSTVIVSGSTAGSNVFTLNKPIRKGVEKRIVVDVNTTDAVDVITPSSLATFFGSTANALRFSTGAVTPKRAELLSLSSEQWAVTYLSTGVTVIGSTA